MGESRRNKAKSEFRQHLYKDCSRKWRNSQVGDERNGESNSDKGFCSEIGF